MWTAELGDSVDKAVVEIGRPAQARPRVSRHYHSVLVSSLHRSIYHSLFLLPPSSFFQFQRSDFRGGQKSNSLVWHSTTENKWGTHQNILYTRPSPHTCRGKIGDESEETCHMKEINIYVEREMTTPLHVYLLFRSRRSIHCVVLFVSSSSGRVGSKYERTL